MKDPVKIRAEKSNINEEIAKEWAEWLGGAEMAEYIKRKILVDLVLSKLKFMGDARIMNQNDEKVLSEIDGYEKAICAVHELILDKDLIEDVQPVKKGKWRHSISYNGFIVCSECKHEAYWDTDYGQQLFDYCPYCGARMDGEKNDGEADE